MPSLRPVALASALLAVALLSGCTGGAAPVAETKQPAPKPSVSAEAPAEASGQSVEEACSLLEAGVQPMLDMASDGSDPMAEAMADPQGAVAELRAAADAFSEAAGQVTNPEVLVVAEPAHAALASYADTLEQVLAEPLEADLAAMQADAQAMGEQFTSIGEVCG